MNLYEARDLINQLYPNETITESFPNCCISKWETSLDSEGLMQPTTVAVANKVHFDITNNDPVEMSISNHRMQVATKGHLDANSTAKIGIPTEDLDIYVWLVRANTESVVHAAVTARGDNLQAMYDNFNHTQAEVDALVAAHTYEEADYQAYKATLV